MNWLEILGSIVVLFLVGYILYPQVDVCTYNGNSYASVYDANAKKEYVQSFGKCVTVDIVTIDSSVLTNPVEQASIFERVGTFVYQMTSYPAYWVTN